MRTALILIIALAAFIVAGPAQAQQPRGVLPAQAKSCIPAPIGPNGQPMVRPPAIVDAAQLPAGASIVPGLAIVEFCQTNPTAQAAILKAAGAEMIDQSVDGRTTKVRFLDGDQKKGLAALNAAKDVVIAQAYVTEVATHYTPNDPYRSQQNSMTAMQLDQAIDLIRFRSRVSIGIIDTGVNNHPDLQGTITYCKRIYGGVGLVDGNCADAINHGTHVAGTMAANTDNGIGVSSLGGVNGVNLYVIRACEPIAGVNSATCNRYDVRRSLEAMANLGQTVVNMSLGWRGDDANLNLYYGVRYAIYTYNVFLVLSAGNDNLETSNCANAAPMCYATGMFSKRMLVVGNASNWAKAPTSNFSFATDANGNGLVGISAPGTNVLSTCANGGYCTLSGTSMASPAVAALAAVCRQQIALYGGTPTQAAIYDSILGGAKYITYGGFNYKYVQYYNSLNFYCQ